MFVLSSLLIGAFAHAQTQAHAAVSLLPVPLTDAQWNDLAHDKIWLRQLQYRETLSGQWRSEAAASFFLAPNGKTDPTAELKANYEVLLNHPEQPWGYTKQPVICALPTRREFLESHLHIQFKAVPCPERDEWMKPFLGSTVYLVYSDSFPNNPASMFGHTFMLFSKNSPPDSAKGLLDYTVNFAADTFEPTETEGQSHGLIASIKGLFGFFQGRYRIYKFYQLTNQYLNSDSRDLWYLKLPFTDQQVQRLLNHVWEVFTSTEFDYYFFDENCAYRILTAFDYADPNLNLIEEFHYKIPLYYVSPLATYRRLAEKYPQATEHYSMSIRKRLRLQIHQLDHEDRQRFDRELPHLEGIETENHIAVLDSLSLFYDYKKRAASSMYMAPDTLPNLQKALARRAAVGSPSPDVHIDPPKETPRNSHLNRAVWLGASQSSLASGYAVVGARASYHDFMNDSAGYDRWGSLSAFSFELWQSQTETRPQYFQLVNIRSIFPVESFEIKPSWRADLGFDNIYKYYARGGIGYSKQSFDETNLAYFFISPVASSNTLLTQNAGAVVEAEIGIAREFAKIGKINLEFNTDYQISTSRFASNYDRWLLQFSYFAKKNEDLRLLLQTSSMENWGQLIWQHQF